MPLDILFWNSTGLDQTKLTAVLTIANDHNIDLVVLQEASSAASGLAPPHGYTLAAHDKESVGGTATSRYYAVYYRGVVTSVVNLGLMTIPPDPRQANDEYLTARPIQGLRITVGPATVILGNWHAPQPANYAAAAIERAVGAFGARVTGQGDAIALGGDMNMGTAAVNSRYAHVVHGYPTRGSLIVDHVIPFRSTTTIARLNIGQNVAGGDHKPFAVRMSW
jgi:hypothetical protein